jgi:D-arabinose 1-dehydrogenase-like Zn-dependent alcohol dehydrogenase
MEPAGLSPPIVLGHENAGWVEATGDFVATVAPGDGVSSTRRTAAARASRAGAATTCTAGATSSLA